MNSGKAWLGFDMSDPDQKLEHEMVLKAGSAHLALEEVREMIRQIRKHDPPKGKEGIKLIDKLWDRYHEIMSDNGLGV